MPRRLTVSVATSSGMLFDADVANLSPYGLFLRTSVELAFRQQLTLELGGHEIRAEVLFTSNDPPGAVVAIHVDEDLAMEIELVSREVEVLTRGDPRGPWAETTQAEAGVEVDQVPEVVGDPWSEQQRTHPGDVASEIEPGVEALPILEPENIMVLETGAETPRDPAVPEPPPPPSGPDEPLPTLADDGVTVHFLSPDAYRKQLTHHLRHGGLVVRAEPLPVGTQRLLALAVPGRDPYTLSARVIFTAGGRLGFAVDSFPLHKGRLTQLGA